MGAFASHRSAPSSFLKELDMPLPFVIALAAATVCLYDPSSAKPNPIGMRAYVSIVSESPTKTRFLYDSFGTAAHEGAGKREITINAPLTSARVIMRTNRKAWAALIGELVDQTDDTYARLDPLLKCSHATAQDLKTDPERVRVRFVKS